MYWVNGQPQSSISLTDRSFQYGDGCFTTMLTVDGHIAHWLLHIERMESCLALLDIPAPDWALVHQWLTKAAVTQGKAGLKLHISRGEGGRGYSPTQVGSPNVTISAFAFPSHYEQWREDGVALGVSSVKLGHNPLLAGHKHNNRIEQILIKSSLERAGYIDGVVLDIQDRVIESSMANLFWRQGKTLYTPNLENAGVSGVMRRLTLAFASTLELSCHIGEYSLSDLLSADEIFMSNSLMGIVPITAVTTPDNEIHTFVIGNITKEIQERLNS